MTPEEIAEAMPFDRAPDHHDGEPTHDYCPECNVCKDCTENEIASALRAERDKVQAAREEGRREGLEEAARLIEDLGDYGYQSVAKEIRAQDIRALASAPKKTDKYAS